MPIEETLASGARIELRDAEWIVRRADTTSTGGKSLLVTGVSEIVRGREARFLTEIEGKSLRVLDPAETKLVPDPSSQFSQTRLYLESLLRMTPPTDTKLWIGHKGAVDELPYQLDPAIQALEAPRPRILIADAVGLGKTIECGILLSELIKRGRARRILVVTVKSMMTQFQTELWSRFTIPLIRLDSAGIDRIRTRIPANANPFHYYDRTIVSIDTLKQQNEFRVYLETCRWDVIVIDEAHNVAKRGKAPSDRAKLAELLASRSDALILTSATPHDGKAASFASLMNMLNPTAIANPKEYGPEDIEGLFLRRFKKDVQEQLGRAFLERRTNRWPTSASEIEEHAYDLVSHATFASFEKAKKTGQLLFRTVLEKSLFSSPAACRKTIEQRLKKIEDVATPEADQDRDTLQTLADAVDAITPDQFSKYQQLLTLLRKGGDLDWHPEQPGDRLVIFTERVETLKFLKEHLERDLNLKPAQIATLHGQESGDQELQKVVEAFGRDKEPVRLLIATDIASEGINLHFLAHKLIHFDIPWSLMVFQQRNGRIDRYGQEKQPLVAYIPTESSNPKIRGDQRILELLTIKDEQAQKNIGDPSAFLNVYDAVQEELEVGKAIERSLSVEQFDHQMQQTAKAADLLAILMGVVPPPKGETAPSRKRKTPSLYATDLDYIADGLASDSRNDFTIDRQRQMVSMTLPRDLERSLKRLLPKGALPDDGRLHLTSDAKLVQEEIRKTRSGERLWPQIHLLWDLHPAVEWLNYKLLVNFDRAQAPVVTLKSILDRQELVFLMQGETPNRKGQPVIHRWFGVRFESGKFAGIEPLEHFLERTGFHRTEFANPALLPDVTAAGTLLPEAVRHGRKYMSECRAAINSEMLPKLEAERKKLEALQTAKKQQLEIDFGEGAAVGVRLRLKQARARKIDDIFAHWTAYVQDTLTTEDAAFLRVAAVFRGE